MPSDPIAELKERIRAARERDPLAWERSRQLVTSEALPGTVTRLAAAIREASLPPGVTEPLLRCFAGPPVARTVELPGELLRQLTGLPGSKAVRALCMLFGLSSVTAADGPVLSATSVEECLRNHGNPYDLLLEGEGASLLDLGAGDLSFEEEVFERYGPQILERGRALVVHAIDRLRPSSRLGGPLHPPAARLQRMNAWNRPPLEFRFWGDQDMFALHRNPHILPTYTIVTCHAPATPTFAYEPTRLSESVIRTLLRRLKGESRPVQIEGEPALEVMHSGKALLFPPWKFEIRGPLALLDLVSRRGSLAILSAIDGEVFWELLAQLLADPAFRPMDTVFTDAVVADVFGEVHASLTSQPIGEVVALSDLAAVRRDLPRVLQPTEDLGRTSYSFRTVLIRRGATFPETPTGLTARLFKEMKQETVPWCVLLVPEDPTV